MCVWVSRLVRAQVYGRSMFCVDRHLHHTANHFTDVEFTTTTFWRENKERSRTCVSMCFFVLVSSNWFADIVRQIGCGCAGQFGVSKIWLWHACLLNANVAWAVVLMKATRYFWNAAFGLSRVCFGIARCCLQCVVATVWREHILFSNVRCVVQATCFKPLSSVPNASMDMQHVPNLFHFPHVRPEGICVSRPSSFSFATRRVFLSSRCVWEVVFGIQFVEAKFCCKCRCYMGNICLMQSVGTCRDRMFTHVFSDMGPVWCLAASVSLLARRLCSDSVDTVVRSHGCSGLLVLSFKSCDTQARESLWVLFPMLDVYIVLRYAFIALGFCTCWSLRLVSGELLACDIVCRGGKVSAVVFSAREFRKCADRFGEFEFHMRHKFSQRCQPPRDEHQRPAMLSIRCVEPLYNDDRTNIIPLLARRSWIRCCSIMVGRV